MAHGQQCEGYNCTFVESPKLVQCECPVCLLVLREPHLVSCCGHNFCRACIAVVQNHGESCPFCRTSAFTTMRNKGLERTLKSLIVKCEHERVGCTWSDELGKYDRHLEAVCLYVDVGCKHGCSTVIKRIDIAEHEDQCGRRPFCCSHCNVYESTYDDVVTAHHLVCSNAPVPCPQGCNAILERQHLQKHTVDVCPNTMVECDFSYCGCSAKLTRQELLAHLDTNLSLHMSMLSKMNRQLLLEVQQLKGELNEHKLRADAMTSYLKTSPTLNQDVLTTVEVGLRESFVSGQTLLKKNFYSRVGGYKMQLQIHCRTSEFPPNTVHLYPRVYLMKGEFDEFLLWPFKGVVIVSTRLSRAKLCINFNDASPECRARVLDGSGIAEKGVNSDSAVMVDVNKFRVGDSNYRGVFAVEKVY